MGYPGPNLPLHEGVKSLFLASLETLVTTSLESGVGRNSRFMVRSSKVGSPHFHQSAREAKSAVKDGRNKSFTRKTLRMAEQKGNI